MNNQLFIAMDTKEKMFADMSRNASEQDIDRIRKKLGGMNLGKIAEIWDKVISLWKFVQDPEAPWAGKAIAIGALVWWFGITFFVNKVRKKFNLRGIWILNRIIGSIVMLVSAVGLVYTLLGESIY